MVLTFQAFISIFYSYGTLLANPRDVAVDSACSVLTRCSCTTPSGRFDMWRASQSWRLRRRWHLSDGRSAQICVTDIVNVRRRVIKKREKGSEFTSCCFFATARG